jgi:hypothetical protein
MIKQTAAHVSHDIDTILQTRFCPRRERRLRTVFGRRTFFVGVFAAALRGRRHCHLTRIMHYAALFCTSGELARADIPSGEIGVRQLVMQRVRG